MTPVESAGLQGELKRARRMVAVFWAFTVLYVVLSAALLVTRGVSGLIVIAILTWSWFFRGWPDTKPYFTMLREAKQPPGAAPGSE